MLQAFRVTAILEGISYLLLFTLSMPLKYWAGIGEPNTYIGYAHGFLFIGFMVMAVVLTFENKWGIKRLLVFALAALLPFGTFYVERKYLRPVKA